MAYTNIKKSSDYFNTKLYTGNGSTQSITGVGFQPDLNWTKQRNVNQDHTLTDSIRGVGKLLFSSDPAAENTDVNSLTSFNSDGFSVGTSGYMNTNSNTYASWNWLGANGTSANTDGSISSTVSANTTSGFSIVSYTGTGSAGTVGTGLGAVPKMIIIKDRSAADNWNVYNSSSGNNSHMHLNLNFAATGSSSYWNTTTPTSSVFSLGSSSAVNANGNNFIAYCFADVQGFSKFGSYTGNGNADGTFVYTGFKPAFVMVKRTDVANNWMMIDNKRTPSNTGTVPELFADNNSAENNSTDGRFDYLSNGLKARGTNAVINASGGTYIYMAFAEQPLVGDNPATAR
jgi:hypothetical protein